MKRLTYISRLAFPLSEKEIEEIGLVSAENNQKNNITGVLIYFNELFFQIIEGDELRIDLLYEKIKQDKRHTDILCLKAEYQISERLFPDWSMNTINLNNSTDVLIRPIKILLQNVMESHGIIEKYTQPAVLKILNQGINPLTVPVHKTEKIILFGDIVSFSTISEAIPVEETARLINHYLDICSRVITLKGGEVTKFIGDCVMAYFDKENADNAIQACLDILKELKHFREISGKENPLSLLYCGFGISQGVVIEGNIGSSVKSDYTIIGDAVNTAARLEALTRDVGKAVVFSDIVKNSTKKAWKFKYLGKHDLKGKENITEVYSVEDDLVNFSNVKDKIIRGIKIISNRRL